MQSVKMIKFSLSVNHILAGLAYKTLEELQLPFVYSQTARAGILGHPNLLSGLTFKHRFESDRIEFFHFYTPLDMEEAAFNRVVHALDLLDPGRGSIYSENAELIADMEPMFEPALLIEPRIDRVLSDQMLGITAIIARGEGDRVTQAVLENGYSTPMASYGLGMGIRSRLGLVRIAIPPEKEILHHAVYHRDADAVMQLIRAEAQLDLPGKGFMYSYPLRWAKINTKTHLGDESRLASPEQMIAAIDELKGNIEWRRKSAYTSDAKPSKHKRKLANVVFIGERGVSEKVTEAAFALGAGGATMTRCRFFDYSSSPLKFDGTHERERCGLAVRQEIVDDLCIAVAEKGFFKKGGIVELSEVEPA